MSERVNGHEPVWSYTVDATEIRHLREKSEARGKQRHSIGRDTPLLEGIYEGTYGGEAIVVDYQADPEIYELALDSVLRRSYSEEGTVDKTKVLDAVFSVVSENMRYSLKDVDGIFQELADSVNNRKIGLSVYIHDRVGVCRHQALFAAALLELLKQKGVVRGSVSVDRNVNWSQNGDPGGHAWARYTNSAGEVYILDPAQKFIGSLEQAVGNNVTQGHGWDYARPEEREQVRNKVLGRNLVTGMIEMPDWP